MIYFILAVLVFWILCACSVVRTMLEEWETLEKDLIRDNPLCNAFGCVPTPIKWFGIGLVAVASPWIVLQSIPHYIRLTKHRLIGRYYDWKIRRMVRQNDKLRKQIHDLERN